MTGTELFDSGLQPERTDLAWRRSTLSVAVGSLIALRLLPPVLGPSGIAAALAGLLATCVIWLLARRRAQCTQHALRHQATLPGGQLLLALTLLAAGGAAIGLLYVAISAHARGTR